MLSDAERKELIVENVMSRNSFGPSYVYYRQIRRMILEGIDDALAATPAPSEAEYRLVNKKDGTTTQNFTGRPKDSTHWQTQERLVTPWVPVATPERVEPESDTREQLVAALMGPRVVKAAKRTWKLATSEAEAFADVILARFTVTEKADRP